MAVSAMKAWREKQVNENGSATLVAAMHDGQVTVQAAFLATRLLDKHEQIEAVNTLGKAQFSRRMAQLERERAGGRTVRMAVTPFEREVIEGLRAAGESG